MTASAQPERRRRSIATLLHGGRAAAASTNNAREASREHAALAILVLGCLATIVLYFQGLPGAFLLDDHTRLPGINPEGLAPAELFATTLQNLHGLFGRPVSVLSLAFTKATSGAAAGDFKYQNILLHVLTGLLQAWSLAYIIGAIQDAHLPRPFERPRWLPGAAIATLWMLHPLFVSTVLYPVQRIAILAALFGWLSILTYILGRHALSCARNRRAGALLFIATPVSMLLAMASKENAALIPVYLLLIHVFVPLRGAAGTRARRIHVVSVTLLIALPLAAGAVYGLIHYAELTAGFQYRNFSLPERLLTQGYVIWQYVGLMLVPLLRNMTIFHDNITPLGTDHLPAYMALASLVAVAILAFLTRHRAPLISFGILFFLASHLMESSFLPLELKFEHRNYMGGGGLLLMVYGILIPLRPDARALPAIACCIAAVGFALLLGIRAWTWSDHRSLVFTTIQEHPQSVRAHVEAANLALREGNPQVAAQYLTHATQIARWDAGPLTHLYSLKCSGDLAEDVQRQTRRAVRTRKLTPYAADGLQKIAILSQREKCPNIEPTEAIDLIDTALSNPSIRPAFAYHLNVAAAKLLFEQGHHAEALQYSGAARELSSHVPLTSRHRALVLEARAAVGVGQVQRAIDALETIETLSRNPRFRHAHQDLVPRLRAQIMTGEQSEVPGDQ